MGSTPQACLAQYACFPLEYGNARSPNLSPMDCDSMNVISSSSASSTCQSAIDAVPLQRSSAPSMVSCRPNDCVPADIVPSQVPESSPSPALSGVRDISNPAVPLPVTNPLSESPSR